MRQLENPHVCEWGIAQYGICRLVSAEAAGSQLAVLLKQHKWSLAFMRATSLACAAVGFRQTISVESDSQKPRIVVLFEGPDRCF